MVEQSSVKLVAGALALLLLVPALGINMQAADAATAAGIMVPLYTYPGGTWDTVVETKNDHPEVPIVAIVNPASGPGGSKDSNYVSGIEELKDAGVIVIGYVSTAYTGRSLTEVKGDIDKWDSWYDIDGIFFDEQTNWAGKESYYADASDYAESKGVGFTVGNPGANSLPSYLSTVDVVLIYESPGLPNLNNYDSWDSYGNDQLGMIPFGVSSLPTSWLEDAIEIVGWVYVTSDNLPNPWDSLPSYFDDMAELLDGGSSAPSEPADPEYSLTVKSVDQTGKEFSGMWTEVKKGSSTVKTGYTPLSYEAQAGSTYEVSVADYKNNVFDHWESGSKSSTRQVTVNSDTTLTAYYGTGSTKVTLTIKTVGLDGKSITGLWTVISGAGSATGYSPLSYTANAGSQYTVTMSEWQNNKFDHWDNGSMSKSRTITPNSSTVLTAYYRQ
jgi:hypothetical protein